MEAEAGGIAGRSRPTGAGRRRGRRATPPSVHAVLVELPLLVDRLLDVLGVADVAEHLAPELARRADDQVAGADHAFEHALVEADVVDRLERDLHRALGDPALAVDDPVRGHDEVRRRPRDELADREPEQDEDREGRRAPEHGVVARAVVGAVRDREGPPDDHEDRDDRRHHQGDPVRPQLEDQLLVLDQELAGERHGRILLQVLDRPEPHDLVPRRRSDDQARRVRPRPRPRPRRPLRPPSPLGPGVPSVAHTSRYAAITLPANAGCAGSYPRTNADRNASSSSSSSASTAPAPGTSRWRGAEVHADADHDVLEPAAARHATRPGSRRPCARRSGGRSATCRRRAGRRARSRLAPSRSPASSVSRPPSPGRARAAARSENINARPGSSSHVRPRRPRPCGLVPRGDEGPLGRACGRQLEGRRLGRGSNLLEPHGGTQPRRVRALGPGRLRTARTIDSRSGVPDCSVGTGFRGPSGCRRSDRASMTERSAWRNLGS